MKSAILRKFRLRFRRHDLIAAGIFSAIIISSVHSQVTTNAVVAVYGDTRTHQEIHQEIAKEILKYKPVAIFHTGDFSDGNAKGEEWRRFVDIVTQMNKTAQFFPVLGNYDGSIKTYFRKFASDDRFWYSTTIGHARFIVLDSNSDLRKESIQFHWLESELKNLDKNVKFVIVLLHHPPFRVGLHSDEKGLQLVLVPLLSEYGVDVVMSGHDHAYERAFYNDTYYLVTGGGGAPLNDKKRKNLYNQVYKKVYHFCILSSSDTTLLLNVYDIKGNIIDSLTLKTHR